MSGAGGFDVSEYIPNQRFMGIDEENESDNIGDDAQNGGGMRKSHRHTPEQIQELENFFKECPHPSENQKLDLGQRLNLETRQIRFWFQNRRTQAKTQQERDENKTLRQEQDRLRRDQELLRQAMICFSCSTCGSPTNFAEVDFEAHQLLVENTKLKQVIDQLYSFLNTPNQSLTTASEALQPSSSSSLTISNPGRNVTSELDSGGETSMMMNERSMLLDIATAAMNELIMLGEVNSPFWRTDSFSKRESLNCEEYKSVFRNGIKPHGYVMEATRETGLVLMTSLALVKTLMDTKKWVNVFAPIVSVASSHKVLPIGHGGARSGSLQVIQAEFQVISPLVPKRQVKFLRYCKELSKGLWIVVDVTPCHETPDWFSNGGSSRLPSGLIIEDITNGYSKVTWIEQAEYDESHIHQIYQLVVGSGIGLGAKRWLTTLQRQCESFSTLSSINLTHLYPGLTAKGATELVKLAQRMTLSYYSCITGSSMHEWERVQVEYEGQNMRLMVRKNLNEQIGEQTGIVLSASTSVWFPVNPQALFYFLGNPSFRNQWDILTYNTSIEDTIKIEKSKRHGNYVSLLKILGNGMLVLQEVLNDASGAFVIYAPVENSSMEEVMRGENSDSVKLLPSGFSILPDGETDETDSGSNKSGGGCLLTIGLQILVSSKPAMEFTQDSVKIVEELVARTIDKIKLGLQIQT